MVYDTRVTGFGDSSASSDILKIRKQRFGNWICFRLQLKGGIYSVTEVSFF
jgi:hypothetical protein